MNNQSRDQISDCVIQLAERCRELGNEHMGYVLLSVSAAFKEGSENILSSWMKEYAHMRIDALQDEIDSLTSKIDNIDDLQEKIDEIMDDLDENDKKDS